MSANPERGEVDILLDGKAYPMRPTFQAVQAVERETGHSLVALVRKAAAKDLSIETMAVIVTETVRAAGQDRGDPMLRNVSTERIAQLLYEGGVMNAQPAVFEILLNALNGGRPPQKKDTAADETGTTTDA